MQFWAAMSIIYHHDNCWCRKIFDRALKCTWPYVTDCVIHHWNLEYTHLKYAFLLNRMGLLQPRLMINTATLISIRCRAYQSLLMSNVHLLSVWLEKTTLLNYKSSWDPAKLAATGYLHILAWAREINTGILEIIVVKCEWANKWGKIKSACMILNWKL